MSWLNAGCSTQETRLAGTDWEMKVSKGTPAPYDGVIVPFDAYRYYAQDRELFPDCNKRLQAAFEESVKPEPLLTEQNVLIFLTGVLGGMLLQHFR
jgi:hypothetical protein